MIMTIQDFSTTVGTSAMQIYPAFNGGQDLVYVRVTNIASLAPNAVWLSRTGNAAVGAPGSYPLYPGDSEVFQFPQHVPLNALTAVAAVGPTPITVQVAVDNSAI